MKKIYENLIFTLTLAMLTILGMEIFSSLINYRLNNFSNLSAAPAFAQSSLEFAKVKSGCILYKTENTASDDFQNMYFEIPESYFVNIISRPKQNIFKVKYGDFIGFIDVAFASIVSFTPKTPTLSGITFSIKSEAGTQLRNSPDAQNSNNILTNIPANAQGLTYIAKLAAERPTGGTSDVWYYAIYSPQNSPTSVYYGYVYSERTENLTVIPANIENDIIEQTSPELLDNNDGNDINIIAPVRAVLIGLVCLPVVILFIVFLMKMRSHKKQNSSASNFEHTSQPSFQFQNTPPAPVSNFNARKSIKSFINKSFYKTDKIKNLLASSNSVAMKSNLALDALDDEDDRL